MKFKAEVVDYRLTPYPGGTRAIIRLEVSQKDLDDSYFMGGLISKEAVFTVEDIVEDINE
jgi:hypothetical protein